MEMSLFIVIMIILGVALVSIIIATFCINKLYPFKKMRTKQDFDNCYDLTQKQKYYSDNIQKSITKRRK